MANITISDLTGKTAVATDEIEVQATAAGASNKVTLASAFAANNGATLDANTFTALQTITQAGANAGVLASTGYSLTGSNATSMVDLAGTWNTSGVPTALKVAITKTASGTGSLLASFTASGAGSFELEQAGELLIGSLGSAAVRTGNPGVHGTTGGSLHFGASNGAAYLGDTGTFGASARINNTALVSRKDVVWGWSSDFTSYGSQDLFLLRSAAATLQQGAANAASPVAQVLQAQGSRGGTDTDVAGASYTIRSGTGTGTGAPSSLILQSPVAVASGTGAQTNTTGLTIKAGCAIRPSYTVATLPAAADVGAGAMAWVTDANATTFLSTVAGGGANKVPVSCDGTNWLIG